MHGQQEGVIPGHAVVVDPTRPFSSFGKFGSAFLQRFQISQKDSPVLRSLNIIDTPGALILARVLELVRLAFRFLFAFLLLIQNKKSHLISISIFGLYT